MRRFWLFLLGILVLSCNHSPPPKLSDQPPKCHTIGKSMVFHGDPDFTDREKKLLEISAEYWWFVSQGHTKIEIVWDLDMNNIKMLTNENLLISVPSSNDIVKQNDSGNWMVLGLTYSNVDNKKHIYMVVDRLKNGRDYVGVAVHEMGHALGLDHIPFSGSLMSAVHTPGQYYFTKVDLQWCALHCLCPWR